MSNQVRSAGTITDDNAVGSLTWGNPTFAASSNDQWATATGSGTTHYLKCLNFGFSVTGTILGITARIERHWNSVAVAPSDNIISLVKGGTVSGDNKAAVGTWPGTDAYATYGGPADMWGLTLTASDVNASNFGIVISAKDQSSAFDVAYIDHVELTVEFAATISLPRFRRTTRIFRSR